MPFRFKDGPVSPPPEPSLWDRIGGLGGAAAAVTRGVGGLLSSPGGWWGAGVSGVAEGLAQKFEGQSLKDLFDAESGARIAAEAGLGAIPGRWLFKAGSTLGSALRGGAYAGAGSAIRDVASGQDVDFERAGVHSLLGGGISGALSRFDPSLPKIEPSSTGYSGARPQAVIARERVSAGSKSKKAPFGAFQEFEAPPARVSTRSGLDESDFEKWLAQQVDTASPIIADAEHRAALRARGLDPDAADVTRVPYGMGGPTPQTPSSLRSQRLAEQDTIRAQREADRLKKIAEEEEARTRIAQAREGLTPEEAVSETISAPIPGGRETLRTRFVRPDEDEGGGALDDLGELLGAPSRGRRTRSDAVTERVPVSEIPDGPLGEVYQAWRSMGRTHADALKMTGEGFSPIRVEGLPHLRVLSGVTPSAPRVAEPPSTPPSTPRVEPVESRAPQALDDVIEGGPFGPSNQPRQLGTRLQSTDPDEVEGIEALLSRGIDPETIASVLARTPGRVGASEDPVTVLRRLMGEREGAPQAPLASSIAEVPTSGGGEELARLLGIEPSPLKFFRSRAGAAGQAYGDIRRAQKAQRPGEPPIPEEGVQAARSARIRESEAFKQNQPRPVVQAAPEATAGAPEPEGWVKEGFDFLNRVRGKLPPSGGESGAVNPEVLQSLTGMGAGALIGGAADPLGDPYASAFVGGVLGGLTPQAIRTLREIGAPETSLGNVDLSTPERIKQSAIKIVESLPSWQRFNLLADPEGLAANAIAGPYGAVLTGAIEATLKGDPRGQVLLRLADPRDFLQNMNPLSEAGKRTAGEAVDLIRRGEQGRLEGLELSAQADPVEVLRSGPGVYMTMGDSTARRLMRTAGFSDDEARAMTFTSEPLTRTGRGIAHLGQEPTPEGQFDIMKFLWNTQLPFRRTPVNVGEQGSMRVPGLGYFQSQLLQPEATFRDMAVQQGMGAGIMGLNYGLASELSPEEARTARRFATNLSGRYALPAAIGFAAGQAEQRGSDPFVGAVSQGIGDIVPVPEDVAIRQWMNFLTGNSETVPQGALPKILREQLNEPTIRGGLTPMRAPNFRFRL